MILQTSVTESLQVILELDPQKKLAVTFRHGTHKKQKYTDSPQDL